MCKRCVDAFFDRSGLSGEEKGHVGHLLAREYATSYGINSTPHVHRDYVCTPVGGSKDSTRGLCSASVVATVAGQRSDKGGGGTCATMWLAKLRP